MSSWIVLNNIKVIKVDLMSHYFISKASLKYRNHYFIQFKTMIKMLITNCFLAVAKINTNQQAATQIKPFLFVNSNLFFLVQSCLTSITYSELLDGSFPSRRKHKLVWAVSSSQKMLWVILSMTDSHISNQSSSYSAGGVF